MFQEPQSAHIVDQRPTIEMPMPAPVDVILKDQMCSGGDIWLQHILLRTQLKQVTGVYDSLVNLPDPSSVNHAMQLLPR